MDFTELIVYGKSIRTWSSGFSAETMEAIKFASQQGVECMTQEYALKDLDEAFKAMNDRTVRFRPVINFDL